VSEQKHNTVDAIVGLCGLAMVAIGLCMVVGIGWKLLGSGILLVILASSNFEDNP
jgi:hypothetical protein